MALNAASGWLAVDNGYVTSRMARQEPKHDNLMAAIGKDDSH